VCDDATVTNDAVAVIRARRHRSRRVRRRRRRRRRHRGVQRRVD